MTQHSSLKSGRRRKRHRSVLKRFERINTLKDKEEWESGDSVYGLPKVRNIRVKVKKEKVAAEAEAAPEGAVTPETQAAETPEAAAPEKEKAPPKKEKEK